MPTYEYECDSCGHGFETVQKMMDEPLKICPECGKSVRRILSGGIGISFKGSGFYVTDKGSPSSSAKGTSAAPAAPAASSASSSGAASPSPAAPSVKTSGTEKTHK